jgi:hypothetical protein
MVDAMSRLSALTTVVERTLLACSVLLVLAIHLGGWLAPGWTHSHVPLAEEIWQLLPAAQIVLLAAWLVSGLVPLWLRLASAPVLLCAWATIWGGSLSSHTTAQWLLMSGAIVALVLVAARSCGMLLSKPVTAELNRHPQFSIRGLIVLTTLIAVVLGILEMLRPTLQQTTEMSAVLEQAILARAESGTMAEFFAGVTTRSVVLASALAAVSLAAMACVMRPGPIWLRLIVTAALAPLLGFYLANLTAGSTATGISLAVSLTVLAAITGISVWPLRLLGVRLTRRTGFQPVLAFFIWDRLKTCPTGKTHEPRTAAA